MLAPLLITAMAAGGVAAGWVVIGPTGPVFAAVTQGFLLAWAALGFPHRCEIPDWGWLRVRRWEPRLYAGVGVELFGTVLDLIGWNRVVTAERGFDGTRRGLGILDQHTRRSEIGHSAGMVISVGLAIAAMVWGSWVGALWLVGLAMPVHLYPAWLQRLVRARIQALQQRIAMR
ncbi:hypothetical protein [Bogoriella caseilytica]|uniref:glycosyl-4,4'-diaponeurosporenoate acyltransferase CrtO family protein n=1 Tax=Bogoriella caseilytica TaxID=56055 RepID=UPI0011CE8CAC|nr:hypothetical protein [Bogoriella caseilytica]